METFSEKETKKFALEIRKGTIDCIKSLGFGHIGGCLSVADVLAVLYKNVMRIDPQNPKDPNRDKLVCSKGHAGPAVYATLALKGYFPYEDLYSLNKPGTQYPSHCDMRKTIGIDMTTGSLGQGTSEAVGIALGDRLQGRDARTFLIVGDGELNEGQCWEAAMFTASNKLDNLTWIIDWNKKQLDGFTKDIIEPFSLEEKFRSFGFNACTVCGSDVSAIYNALNNTKGKPKAIVLDTIKGAGVKEVEETFANHSMNVSADVFDSWLDELSKKGTTY